MLRLSSSPTMIDDELSRHYPRHVGAQILLDHAERKVYSGAHSCRCPNGAIDNINSILFHFDLRKTFLELLGKNPVSGCTTAVKQTSMSKNESAGTNCRNTPGYLECIFQKFIQFDAR